MGSIPTPLKKLNNKLEHEDIESIEEIISNLSSIVKPSEVNNLIKVLSLLKKLEDYIKWAEHPVHVNEFKNKYGSTYLQARTSIKDEKGKTKWVSAYLGSLSEFPKGVNDPKAIEMAKPLIRKKLKKIYEIQ
jgi:hypothetical protein